MRKEVLEPLCVLCGADVDSQAHALGVGTPCGDLAREMSDMTGECVDKVLVQCLPGNVSWFGGLGFGTVYQGVPEEAVWTGTRLCRTAGSRRL